MEIVIIIDLRRRLHDSDRYLHLIPVPSTPLRSTCTFRAVAPVPVVVRPGCRPQRSPSAVSWIPCPGPERNTLISICFLIIS